MIETIATFLGTVVTTLSEGITGLVDAIAAVFNGA